MQWISILTFCALLSKSLQNSERTTSYKNANIVFIIADDLGWDDVSFHGSDQVFTPNIDLLAYTGVALSRYYSHSVCTPSRSATLSGKYAHTLGMQGYPLTNGEVRGLPLNVKLLPEHLKDLDYKTHLVGKWHLGHSRSNLLPTSRGFDSHFGHRIGFIDYYDYTSEEYWNMGPVSGLDLYKNLTPAWDTEGYITDVYNKEAISIIQNHDTSKPLFLMVAHNAPHAGNLGSILQAPPEEVRKMRYIESVERRIYAAMVKKLDDSVGDIFNALHKKSILNNTIVVFVSDNGGMSSGDSMNYASNWPLRGLKISPFEGGTRLVGLIWTSKIKNNVWDGYMHSSDWLPTLLGAVGADPVEDIDGNNLWNDITGNKDSKRNEIYEISDYHDYAFIISDEFKYIVGNIDASVSNHQGSEFRGIIGKTPSYTNLIEQSKVHSVLDAVGSSFTMDKVLARQKIRVSCIYDQQKQDLNNSVLPRLCQPSNDHGCLFEIKSDPCEQRDISANHPDLVKTLSLKLDNEKKRMVLRKPICRDLRALPKLHNYTWSTFMDSC